MASDLQCVHRTAQGGIYVTLELAGVDSSGDEPTPAFLEINIQCTFKLQQAPDPKLLDFTF